jgi:hypothetical protein
MAGIADMAVLGLRDDKRIFPIFVDPATHKPPITHVSNYVPHKEIGERS